MTCDGIVIYEVHLTGTHMAVILSLIPCRTMLQVEIESCRIDRHVCFSIVGITVVSDMGSGCKLGLDVGLQEVNRIIAWLGCLGLCTEGTAIVLTVGTCGRRHHKDVTKIHAACAAEMFLRETPDDSIGVDILGTILPAPCTCHRARLYQSERNTCSREGVSGSHGADKRISILCVVLSALLILRCARKKQQR